MKGIQLGRRFSARWASVLLRAGLVLAVAVVAAVPMAGTPVVQAQGSLTLTSTTGIYVALDSNTRATGPQVFTAEVNVCNTGDAALTDVVVYIGNGITPGVFPTMTWGSPPATYSLQTLDKVVNSDNSDATRTLGTIAAHTCVCVYWQLVYPVTSTSPNGPTLNFTTWGTAAGGITVSVPDNVQLSSMISASDNKINPSLYTLAP